MKSFIEFIAEDGMVSACPANAVGDASTVGSRLAGLDANPPVGKKKKPLLSPSPLKRPAPKL